MPATRADRSRGRPARRARWPAAGAAIACALGTGAALGHGDVPPASAPPVDPAAIASGAPGGPPPTWARDVAPILDRHCATCHRPGGAAPFSLLDYEPAAGRASRILAAVAARYMPPWLPDAPPGTFLGERRLDDGDLETLARWVGAGAPRGDPGERPPPPRFTPGWQLGPPDLVVRPPEPLVLPPGDEDRYFNLVVPVPLDRPRWVRAVELRPGAARVVHHAVIQADRSNASRRLDARDPGPGYEGMDMGPAENPGGQFIGWTPGKVPVDDPRLAWRLAPGTDLVVQLHLLPGPEPVTVRPEIGLFFTDTAPAVEPFSLVLRNDDLDIPAGASDYVAEDDLVLPVAVRALGVYPHAHYLGRSMEVFAELPDGRRLDLLHVPRWDFDWQDDYRYARPVRIPAGARVRMRYVYDNSAANPRNPHHAPRRVRFGNRSSDEMATLTLQVVTERPGDRWLLTEASYRRRLERRPGSWFLRNAHGAALAALGRPREAIAEFRRAAELDPTNPAPRYNLGNALLALGDVAGAIDAYRDVLGLDPLHPKARNNLAIAEQRAGRPGRAVEVLREQLELSPRDARVHHNLGAALLGAGEPAPALESLERAAALEPDAAATHALAGEAALLAGRPGAARRHLERAAELDPRDPETRLLLGAGLAAGGAARQGRSLAGEALAERPDLLGRANDLAWRLATAAGAAPPARRAALALAEAALARAGDGIPELLDTAAAANAASGRFDRAVLLLERAVALAAGGGAARYLPEFRERLERYRRGEPYVAGE